MFKKIKLKVFTKFMKVFGGKILSKYLYDETGCKVNFRFKELNGDIIDDNVLIHIDLDATFNKTLLK